jgi:hypothetical protein
MTRAVTVRGAEPRNYLQSQSLRKGTFEALTAFNKEHATNVTPTPQIIDMPMDGLVHIQVPLDARRESTRPPGAAAIVIKSDLKMHSSELSNSQARSPLQLQHKDVCAGATRNLQHLAPTTT